MLIFYVLGREWGGRDREFFLTEYLKVNLFNKGLRNEFVKERRKNIFLTKDLKMNLLTKGLKLTS